MPNALLAMSGTGQERAVAHHEYDVIDTISYVEPMLFNRGEHPLQTDWYAHLSNHERKVIDQYKNFTPEWSEKRVTWKVAELIISPKAMETYNLLANRIGTDTLLNMQKFLHSDDNASLRKDLYKRMLFNQVDTTESSALNEGIELSKVMGHQPWTMMIDLECPTNKAMQAHVAEFNSWSVAESKAVGICVSGGTNDQEVLYDELLNVVNIELPKNFSNKTAQEKIITLCHSLHKAGYKVVLFSKGMAFKSNSVSYIEVVLHLRDGGAIDIRYQAGARGTTPGVRWNGSEYVQKEIGYDIYVGFNSKPAYNTLRQVLWTMQNDTTTSINKQRPSGALSDFDPTLFYKTISVGSNQYGNFRWMAQEEAYDHCNHPDVLVNLASTSLMGFEPSDFDDDCIEIMNLMISALGTTRKEKPAPITNTKIGGKTKPTVKSGAKGQVDQSKKDIVDQMEIIVLVFENLLANTHDIMYLAEDEGLVNILIDNWDFYAILRQLDNNEIIIEMFGVSGSQIASLLEKMSVKFPILQPVSINQLVRAKING